MPRGRPKLYNTEKERKAAMAASHTRYMEDKARVVISRKLDRKITRAYRKSDHTSVTAFLDELLTPAVEKFIAKNS